MSFFMCLRESLTPDDIAAIVSFVLSVIITSAIAICIVKRRKAKVKRKH